MVIWYRGERLIHMLPPEARLWSKFLDRHMPYFDKFTYDVHVGEGIPVNPAWPENIKVAAKALTTKRIDAVGYRGGEVWIFEIKPDAGLSAYGQLLAYKFFYLAQFGTPERLYLALVTENILPDERKLYEAAGIRVYVV